jgi:hypothetical protein
MKRTINSDGFIKEECDGVTAYYGGKYLFSKLKRRIQNEEANKKLKIKEPINIELEVIDLAIVEKK